MTDSKLMLYAKNLICVCIESKEGADFQGLIYHQYADDPVEFAGVLDFFMKVEGLFDEWDFPQRGLAQRSFVKSSKGETAYNPKNADDKLLIDIIQEKLGVRNVQKKKGKLGTFVIQVVFRQNASWQGHVICQEKNEKKDFESALELVKYMDGAI